MTIAPEHRRLEIGWTWVGTAYQRTGANREAKFLQLTHAFETLDAERVEFKTHARNEQSRGALLGIGATFEGVLRHHTIMPDGSNRDSAFYSVLAGEWPRVKAQPRGAARPLTEITTTDYHTGGEPFRIVTGGVPALEGRTVPERRRWAAANIDHVRQLLVNEPRGHADMYGGFVTPPNDDGGDLGVVFFHNEGYSTACGHGTIALVTWAIDTGRVAVRDGASEVDVTVDVPSGRLACTARLDDAGRVEAVRFRNVPSFVLARDVAVETSRGPLTLDVAFGGAFYGSLDVRRLGLRVEPAALPELIALQRELRPALERAIDVVHPHEPDLRGIYGVIFWEPSGGSEPTASSR